MQDSVSRSVFFKTITAPLKVRGLLKYPPRRCFCFITLRIELYIRMEELGTTRSDKIWELNLSYRTALFPKDLDSTFFKYYRT